MNRDALRAQLVRHEGLRLRLYKDTVGKWTIGVGHNIEDRGLTQRAAFAILEDDIEDAIRDCRSAWPWFDGLDHARQRVLVNMVFNMGLAKMRQFTHTLAAIAAGDYARAAVEMLDSRWADQVGTRALELAEQMRQGGD